MPAGFPDIEVIVANIQRRRALPPPTWSPDELRALATARDELSRIHPNDPMDRLFHSIRACFPIEMGMVESYLPFNRSELSDTLFHVPEGFLVDVARMVDSDPTIDIVSSLPPGCAARFTDVVDSHILQGVPLFQGAFAPHELAGSSLLTVSSGSAARPEDNVTLYIFQGRGDRAPTWRECRMLELLHPDIEAALRRMRLPVLPHEPIRYHVMRSEGVGYVLLRGDLEVMESNTRAHAIAAHYVGPGAGGRRGAPLRELLRRAIRAGAAGVAGGPPLMRPDGRAILRARAHPLDSRLIECPERALLVELEERPKGVEAPDPGSAVLTPRQRQVAALLATSGLSYKEIAGELGLSEGTVRVHAERIYRVTGVRSRPELMARFL